MNNEGLQQAFETVGNLFGLDSAKMIRYAKRDKFSGNDEGNDYGISFGVEGRFLYGLLRELKPARVLEIGTHHGGSASHLALACKHNRRGHVWTFDISEHAGKHFEGEVVDLITYGWANAETKLREKIDGGMEPFDFIFEDGGHSEHQVHTIYNMLPSLLKPGCFIISHDIAMEGVGQYILNGMKKAGVRLDDVKVILVPPSPCGLGIYQFDPDNWNPII